MRTDHQEATRNGDGLNHSTEADVLTAVPPGIIRVHYHRFDESYEDVMLWTWDAAHHQTPVHNELPPAGRDSYGVYFDLHRASYGVNGSGLIGLLPRFGRDWNRKDGPDRFWTPQRGDRVWIMASKPAVYSVPPDVSPQVLSAYADAPNRLTVVLNRLVTPMQVGSHAVTVSNATHPVPVSKAALIAPRKDGRSFQIEVELGAPVDLVHRSHHVTVAGFKASVPVIPRGLLDNRELFYDADVRLGAICSAEATTFRVFAPTATEASVLLFDMDACSDGKRSLPMLREKNGIWALTVNEALPGKYYAYSFKGHDLDSANEVVDPYAINTVANSTRARITDLATTNPPGWERLKRGPAVASPVDMVVYEMHVRDFTIAKNSGVRNRGLYSGWTESGTRFTEDHTIKTGLDHLVELGVTHVQILPVHDFGNDEASGAYDWGYMTSAFFSPEGMYACNTGDDSRIRELKGLIAALHARGIGVILDVVYNHTSECAPFNHVAPGYYYRQNGDGSLSNGSGCGNEFRTEAPMGRKLVIDSLKYWVEEYGVDGFRFDLMALLDRTTMQEAERELRKIRPDIVLYGEPWAAADSPVPERTDKHGIRGTRIGAFNDDFRNSFKGSPDGDGAGWLQNGSAADGVCRGVLADWFGWPDSPEQTVNYLTCHDNLVLFDKLKKSMPHATGRTLIETMKLGYLGLFTSQGVPFIHGGEEFARSKHGHHNSYNAPDSVNEVNWALKRGNYELFTYVRDLIAIRRAHPLFRFRTKEEVAARLQVLDTGRTSLVVFTVNGEKLAGENWKRACVAMNSSEHPADSLPLPEGSWQLAFDRAGAYQPHAANRHQVLPPKSGAIFFER